MIEIESLQEKYPNIDLSIFNNELYNTLNQGTIKIENLDHSINVYHIDRISDSIAERNNFGYKSKRKVPIIIFKESGGFRNGAYNKKLGVIYLFSNTSETTKKHEYIHSIEFNAKYTDELIEFYEKVRNTITEESFSGQGGVSFNFKKDIHEFIADGYSKDRFINALKKEGLYEEFLEKTNYIFDNI